MEKWKLINYFDGWGNPDDGWEVNNLREEFSFLLPTDATHKEILRHLKQVRFFTVVNKRRFAVEENGEFIEIYERKGMKPICALRLLEVA